MNSFALSAALLVGLAGSLHCVAMCGPLAMIVPLRGNRSLNILGYNFARILMYALLGWLFGTLGARITFLEGGQRLSIVIGVVVLVVFVLPMLLPNLFPETRINRIITTKYTSLARPVIQYKGFAAPVLLGMVNGLLPCGLIYVSLSGAVATGSGLSGAAFMAAVGLGTFPAMFFMMAVRKYFKSWMQRGSRVMLTVLAGILGLVMIARGLNLDIPYISPKAEKVTTATQQGCQ